MGTSTKSLSKWGNIQAGLGIASGIAGAANSGRPSFGAGAAQGALSGATAGAALGPWGMAIGGFVGGAAGGIKGAVDGSAAEEQAEQARQLVYRMNQNKVANLAQDPSFLHGGNPDGFYKFGGQMKGANTKGLEELASGSFAVHGPSHEEGGVQVGMNELEGGETISKGFVFSEELGFAKAHKPIAKAIGHLEEKGASPLRNKTLKSLREREQELAMKQEITKLQLGI